MVVDGHDDGRDRCDGDERDNEHDDTHDDVFASTFHTLRVIVPR